jgi:hypothetical protein
MPKQDLNVQIQKMRISDEYNANQEWQIFSVPQT